MQVIFLQHRVGAEGQGVIDWNGIIRVSRRDPNNDVRSGREVGKHLDRLGLNHPFAIFVIFDFPEAGGGVCVKDMDYHVLSTLCHEPIVVSGLGVG